MFWVLLGDDKLFKDVVGSCFSGVYIRFISVLYIGQGLVLLVDLPVDILIFVERNGKKGCKLGVKFSDVCCNEIMFVSR